MGALRSSDTVEAPSESVSAQCLEKVNGAKYVHISNPRH